jgi:hypothetical protein
MRAFSPTPTQPCHAHGYPTPHPFIHGYSELSRGFLLRCSAKSYRIHFFWLYFENLYDSRLTKWPTGSHVSSPGATPYHLVKNGAYPPPNDDQGSPKRYTHKALLPHGRIPPRNGTTPTVPLGKKAWACPREPHKTHRNNLFLMLHIKSQNLTNAFSRHLS